MSDEQLATTPMWFNKDPLGVICAVFVYVLVLGGDLLVLSILSFDTFVEVFFFFIFNSFVALAIWSHLKAMLSDPGVVSLKPAGEQLEIIDRRSPKMKNGELVTTCLKCRSYKPLRAHHCSTCGRCVRNMDHHCPWVNNCVGLGNQKFFILFVAYICISSFVGLGLLVFRLYYCGRMNWTGSCTYTDSWSPIHFILVGVESIVFSLFTLIMLCDQVCGINNDTTTIEKIQHVEGPVGNKGSFISRLQRVFGRPTSWKWLVPVTPNLPREAAVTFPV